MNDVARGGGISTNQLKDKDFVRKLLTDKKILCVHLNMDISIFHLKGEIYFFYQGNKYFKNHQKKVFFP